MMMCYHGTCGQDLWESRGQCQGLCLPSAENHQLVRILVGVMPLTVLTSWEPHSGNVSLPYTMAHFITRALKQLCAPALMVPSKQTNKQTNKQTKQNVNLCLSTLHEVQACIWRFQIRTNIYN